MQWEIQSSVINLLWEIHTYVIDIFCPYTGPDLWCCKAGVNTDSIFQ